MTGPILFVLCNLLVIVTAILVAEMFMRKREPWREALAATCGFPICVISTMQVLGVLGRLSADVVLLVVAGLAIVCIVIRGGFKSLSGVAQARTPISQESLGNRGWYFRVVLAVFVGLCASRIVAYGFEGVAFQVDDFSYHAPAQAEWILEGRFGIGPPYTTSAYFPRTVELLSAWFMLPLKNDALVGLSGAYWLALGAGAMAILARIGGGSIVAAILCSSLFLASTVVVKAARTFSAVDLAGASAMLAAMALIATPSANTNSRDRIVDSAYAGLLVGIALGAKISFAPVVLLVFGYLAIGRRRFLTIRTRFWSALVFSTCVIWMCGYWYVRNWIWTDNPLFPADLGPFSGPWDQEYLQGTKLTSWILADPFNVEQWRNILLSHSRWGGILVLVAIAGYAVAARRLVSKRRLLDEPGCGSALLLFAVGIVFVATYVNLPYSASGNSPEYRFRIHLRYVLLPFCIGIALLFVVVNRQLDRPIARGILFAVLATAVVTSTQHPWLFLGVTVACLSVLAAKRESMNYVGRQSFVTVAGAATLLLLLLAISIPYQASRTAERVFSHRYRHMHVGAAWRVVDALPAGSRIAWFRNNPGRQSYPIYGRDLQLRPVQIAPDGTPARPVHELWRSGQFSIQTYKFQTEVDTRHLENVVDNLMAQRMDYVLVTRLQGADWAPIREALKTSTRSALVRRGDLYELWQVGVGDVANPVDLN